MATITINPGEHLIIMFEGTDGEFEIHFDSPEYPKQLVVRETAGLPGNRAGAALGTLYHEEWADFHGNDADDVREHSDDVDVDV